MPKSSTSRRDFRAPLPLMAIGLLMVSFFPVSVGTAGVTTCRVPQDKSTIQKAINDNSCGRIELASSVFDENIIIDRNVTIIGKGISETTIDGGANDTVVRITPGVNKVTLKGLTIEDGKTGSGGAGIESIAQNLVLVRVKVSDNLTEVVGGPSSANGVGMYVNGNFIGRRIRVTGNSFQGNAIAAGAGIFLGTPGAKATITNSRITNNTGADDGGGIWTQSDLELTNSVISQNEVEDNTDGRGGGIFNQAAKVTIVNSQLNLNLALGNAEGGAYGQNSSAARGRIVGSTLSQNEGDTGGALALDAGAMTVVNSDLAHNAAVTGFGGAIHNQQGTHTTIKGSTFYKNEAGNGGGAIATYDNSTELTITNSTISENVATDWGGGIDASGGDPLVRLTNVTFFDNKSDADEDGFGEGGAFHSDQADVRVKNVISVGNSDGEFNESPDCNSSAAGDITSKGGNVIGQEAGCAGIFTEPGDTTNHDPATVLAALGANGGPTMTHAIGQGTVAVGRGVTGCPKTDQRGAPRKDCESGAYELVRCEGVIVDVVGTAANDKLTGTALANGILGLDGKDKLNGRSGNDGLCGGKGNDRLSGGDGGDGLHGQGGTDVCIGGPGPDTATACETTKSL